MAPPLLEAFDLRFRYPGRIVLDGVSLTLESGAFVGVIGPNGSGKTTLVRLLSRVLSPGGGWIRLLGRDLQEWPAEAVARTLAVVGQDHPLDFDFTVEEVVLMGRYPHLGRWQGESRRDRDVAARSMARCGIAHLAGHLFRQCSGGERQRAIVARALTQEPQVLLLDEPNAHLDITYQVALFDLLQDLAREGMAVLAVLHDLNLAALYCDTLLLLAGGRIVAAGPPAAVLTPAHLAEAYGGQVLIGRHPTRDAPQVHLLPGSGALYARKEWNP
jgi:iron complex transport system ATP-binding protein